MPSTKYARSERERRFLLAGVPEFSATTELRRIEDRYLDGTRLRVRAVRQDGREPVFKLGQKVRLDGGRPGQPGTPEQPVTIAHTTLYLNRAEYDLLRVLPGRDLVKTRTLVDWGDRTVAVDTFTGRLQGLVLAEFDLDTTADTTAGSDTDVMLGPPLPWVAEVTGDERFTGGALALIDQVALRRLLAEHHLDAAPPG